MPYIQSNVQAWTCGHAVHMSRSSTPFVQEKRCERPPSCQRQLRFRQHVGPIQDLLARCVAALLGHERCEGKALLRSTVCREMVKGSILGTACTIVSKYSFLLISTQLVYGLLTIFVLVIHRLRFRSSC
jgi:hypothetical protein